MNAAKTYFVIDHEGIIVVDAEKSVLVKEVIKHFTPRWRGEIAGGTAESAIKPIVTMLKKLSVDIEIAEEIVTMNVAKQIDDAPADAGPYAS